MLQTMAFCECEQHSRTDDDTPYTNVPIDYSPPPIG
jgi:hypothetical protein